MKQLSPPVNSTTLKSWKTTLTYKNIILYFHSSTVTFVWFRRAVGLSSHTEEAVGSWKYQQELTSAKILHLIYTQATHMTAPLHPRNAFFFIVRGLHIYTMLALQLSQLTSTHCLFFIGYDWHPHNACSPLGEVYTNAFLLENFFYSFIYWGLFILILVVFVLFFTTFRPNFTFFRWFNRDLG